MDKSLGTLYNKLSTLFHSNTGTRAPSPTNVSSNKTEKGASVNVTSFFDRFIPNTATPVNSPLVQDRHKSSSRISRQISIKTNGNHIVQETSFDMFSNDDRAQQKQRER